MTVSARTNRCLRPDPHDAHWSGLGDSIWCPGGERVTVTARTVETNTADALARKRLAEHRATVALADLLYCLGDVDNADQTIADWEGSFSSGIRTVKTFGDFVTLEFEDGSVLHLTVTQIKESNPDA